MAVIQDKTKQIQLTLNKLTKAQYDQIDKSLLNTQLSDQLFLTTDDAGGSGGSNVPVSAIVKSGTNIANISVDNISYELYAPSSTPLPENLVYTDTDQTVSGKKTFTSDTTVKKITANNTAQPTSLEGTSLIMSDGSKSYNVNYSQLKSSLNIPTNTSQLINDSGFATVAQIKSMFILNDTIDTHEFSWPDNSVPDDLTYTTSEDCVYFLADIRGDTIQHPVATSAINIYIKINNKKYDKNNYLFADRVILPKGTVITASCSSRGAIVKWSLCYIKFKN